jgi:hypothetical protein
VVTLTFKNFDGSGRIKTTSWKFEPLRNTSEQPDIFHLRDDGKDAGGRLLRQAYFEQRVVTIRIPAAVLRIAEHAEKFTNLLRAIDARVELKNGNEKTATAYIVDLPALTQFERTFGVDRWRTIEITLFEEEPRDLTTWLKA